MPLFKPTAHLRDWKAACSFGKPASLMTSVLKGAVARFGDYDRVATLQKLKFDDLAGFVKSLSDARQDILDCLSGHTSKWTDKERQLVEDKIVESYTDEMAYWKDTRRRLQLQAMKMQQAMDKVVHMGEKLDKQVGDLQPQIDELSRLYEMLLANAKSPQAAQLASSYLDTARKFAPPFKEALLRQESVRKAADTLLRRCPKTDREASATAKLVDQRANEVRTQLNLWGRIFTGYQRELKTAGCI